MSGSGPEQSVAPASRILLDTSTYSHARRGTESAIEAIARAEIVIVPIIVLGELEAGFRLGSRYRENRRALEEFISEPFVVVRDADADAAARYGETFAALRRAGTPIPVNDIWIAAITLSSGAHLVTFDADFSAVAGLSHTLLFADGMAI